MIYETRAAGCAPCLNVAVVHCRLSAIERRVKAACSNKNEDHMKLTRFRGHPNIRVQGAHDGEDETTLHT
jgi:hypothetical protein